MVTRKDYAADAVAAARSVLIELTHLLGEYHDDMVVVGGWVPELLLPNANERHVGSLDVDIAIDHRSIPEHVYRTIQELLLSRGYEQGDQPFVFVRLVENILIEVDLLSGEYGGTGRNRRHQTIQEFKARKARGVILLSSSILRLSLPAHFLEVGSIPSRCEWLPSCPSSS